MRDLIVQEMETELIQIVEQNSDRIDKDIGHAGEEWHSRENVGIPQWIAMVLAKLLKPELCKNSSLSDGVGRDKHFIEKDHIAV